MSEREWEVGRKVSGRKWEVEKAVRSGYEVDCCEGSKRETEGTESESE